MHNADHKKITLRAVNLMRCGTKDKFTHLLDQYGKQIAKKSFDEDVYWHNTRRVVDWHFYKTASAPYPAPLGRFRPFWGIPLSKRKVRPDCRRIVTDIIEDIESDSGVEKILENTGRFIHYIQDMSTPAHVVPIYHGPTYKNYLKKSDGFETFSPTVIDLTLDSITLSAGEISQFEDELNSTALMNFFDLSAGKTLDYLGDSETQFTAEVDGVAQECGTDVFWLTQGDGHSPEYLPGFGRYGKWNTKFGLAKDKTDGSLDLSESKTIYDYLLEKMVIDTIKTLLIIKRQITPHEGG
jgi:hypothetical protein